VDATTGVLEREPTADSASIFDPKWVADVDLLILGSLSIWSLQRLCAVSRRARRRVEADLHAGVRSSMRRAGSWDVVGRGWVWGFLFAEQRLTIASGQDGVAAWLRAVASFSVWSAETTNAMSDGWLRQVQRVARLCASAGGWTNLEGETQDALVAEVNAITRDPEALVDLLDTAIEDRAMVGRMKADRGLRFIGGSIVWCLTPGGGEPRARTADLVVESVARSTEAVMRYAEAVTGVYSPGTQTAVFRRTHIELGSQMRGIWEEADHATVFVLALADARPSLNGLIVEGTVSFVKDVPDGDTVVPQRVDVWKIVAFATALGPEPEGVGGCGDQWCERCSSRAATGESILPGTCCSVLVNGILVA